MFLFLRNLKVLFSFIIIILRFISVSFKQFNMINYNIYSGSKGEKNYPCTFCKSNLREESNAKKEWIEYTDLIFIFLKNKYGSALILQLKNRKFTPLRNS